MGKSLVSCFLRHSVHRQNTTQSAEHTVSVIERYVSCYMLRSCRPTFAFVNNEPKPQNVPPPIDVPPILTYELSDSTYPQKQKLHVTFDILQNFRI